MLHVMFAKIQLSILIFFVDSLRKVYNKCKWCGKMWKIVEKCNAIEGSSIKINSKEGR